MVTSHAARRLRRSRRSAAVAVLALLVASCIPDKPAQPSSTSTAPAVEDRTIRWIPNPAVDLMSPEGTIIRAAVESAFATISSDNHGLDAYQDGYPGYAQAFKNPDADQFGGIAQAGRSFRGTAYYEAIDLSRNGNTFVARVCYYDSMLGRRIGDNYRTGNGLGNSLYVAFGPDPALPPEQQRPPLAEQKGPARQPTDNVFGTWLVNDVSPDGGRSLPECKKLAPGTPANRSDIYIWPEPPPVLPPDPGWPQGSSA